MAKIKRPLWPSYAAWLRSKDPDEIVGKSRDYEACPLTNYLKYTNPWAEKIEVCEFYIYFEDSRTVNIRIPAWAQKHLLDLDEGDPRDITAEDALRLLTKGNQPRRGEKRDG